MEKLLSLKISPMKKTGSEKEFMEKTESGNTEKCGADNDKILEFQENHGTPDP